ncbi:ATP-NAD kinase [Cylindrobasidium torrendii FP15055 ss-10]|uniref:ATP-NAD kinase n=1 Tax=Cylindrobasidium torrendii FP15055 ss-10 TaxID=1314674 RepID=A0A0D7AZL6_9AGAR|nr:ATP-NAD kinase [Cylindrobasidium torrendii FP15055 ss-10]
MAAMNPTSRQLNYNGLLSPDADDTFSTPPTSPMPDPIVSKASAPALVRKTSRLGSVSRPSSLVLDRNSNYQDIVVDSSVSPAAPKTNGGPVPVIVPTTVSSATSASMPIASSTGSRTAAVMNGHSDEPARSPCFVHSHLDQGASLTDWLRNKQNTILGEVGVAPSLQRNGREPYSGPSTADSSPTSGGGSVFTSNEEDDECNGGSLTKQLAETAVSVREMSKQLGRARVKSNIQSILIVTKARDNRLIKLTRQLALYLMLRPRHGQSRGPIVYVDKQLRHSRRFDADGIEHDHPELFTPFPRRRTSSTTSLSSMASMHFTKSDSEFNLPQEEGQLRYWTSEMCSQSPQLFDFVVTLGGDGTVLFTSWLFQRIVPPVLPFALGSLGFLTNFDFADHQSVMDSVLDNGIRVNLRMRFTCTVYRATAHEHKRRKAVKKGDTGEILMKNVEKGGWEAVEGGWSGGISNESAKPSKDREIMCFTTRPVETFEVLNDLVVDRGPSPYVSQLELFGDEDHMTTVQADGLTVSTPTGSTAYSLSAGGSLVHPEIPALLITPICPHTLSFRPMLLPDSMELRICVPYNSRSTAWASFDGRGRVELKQGDHIKVTASKYPFPTVCADKQSTDWFHAISRTLKWNERERQKSFVVVEEGPAKPKKRKARSGTVTPAVPEEDLGDEEEDEVSDDDEEEEEDKFDIDDSSPESAAQPVHGVSKAAEKVAEAKAKEMLEEGMLHRALTESALKKSPRPFSASLTRTPSEGTRSGIQTPGRFTGPNIPHGGRPSNHVGFDLDTDVNGRLGARDDLHSPRRLSGKSRIPVDRDLDGEAAVTPTANHPRHRPSARSRSRDTGHRTFAVWGHDDSDSSTSASDNDS